jgi:hypothetical protein
MKKRKIDIVSMISNICLLVASIFMLINTINEKQLINKWIIGPIFIIALIGYVITIIKGSKNKIIGKEFEVIIDRPLGSTHPEHKDIVYEVNYGYIPKVFAKYGITLDYNPESVDFSQKCPMVLEKIHDIILKNQEAVSFLNEENPNLVKSVSAF